MQAPTCHLYVLLRVTDTITARFPPLRLLLTLQDQRTTSLTAAPTKKHQPRSRAEAPAHMLLQHISVSTSCMASVELNWPQNFDTLQCLREEASRTFTLRHETTSH